MPLAAFAGDTMKLHPALKGHPNLIKAEKDLSNAFGAITKSQDAHECVFGIEGGHGDKAKEAIAAAQKQVFDAAEWVNTHDKDCVGVKGKKVGKVERVKAHGALKGHGNLIKAESELVNAFEANLALAGSQRVRVRRRRRTRRRGQRRDRDRVQAGLRRGRVRQHAHERVQEVVSESEQSEIPARAGARVACGHR